MNSAKQKGDTYIMKGIKMRKIILLLILTGFVLAQNRNLTISYSPGVIEFEEWDGEVDYNTIGIKYNVSPTSYSQWGGFYELDTEEGEWNLLGCFMRSYLQEDIFRPFLEVDAGLVMMESNNHFFVGGKIGGNYQLADNTLEIAFRYIFFETDYQEYYITSAVLGYSIPI